MNPSVAIILVNYNGYDDTVECVDSLRNIQYDNYTVFVVDNDSKDAQKLKADAMLNKHTRLIFSEKNLGFSGGNNLAIEIALNECYDYILLLNNDTTVEPDFLTAMVSTAEKDKHIGVVAGKIYFYYDRKNVWSAGGTYDGKTGLTEQFSGEDRDELNERKQITFATGCLMLIPTKVVREVGLLDESYFLYSEDSDYCQRIIDAGYKLIYEPDAVIYHKVSASTGNRSTMQQRYMMRNNLYMIQKYSDCHIKAYVRLSWHMFKHIVRGRRNLMPTLVGYMDFFQRKVGKIDA